MFVFTTILMFLLQKNYAYSSFLRCFRDRIPVLRIENRVTGIRKIIIRSLELVKIGSLELENRFPTGPYQVPNIFLKKAAYSIYLMLRIMFCIK